MAKDAPAPAGLTAEDVPVVLYLQQALDQAVALRASDLHFEPFEQHYRVRLRVDGQLREIAPPPFTLKDQLGSRIKVLSRLDIAEKRLPQDGRMQVQVAGAKRLDLRVSTLPTLFGEKLVMRVLDGNAAHFNLDTLGYNALQKNNLLRAIQKPHGLVLVTGPTGSGKTQSLYACLNLLNTPDVNIATVEDPSEIQLPGVNQVNVHDKVGLGFSAALRAFLRQDPDILMVGEIRDHETADIAIKASQTGHLVLSSLHTNDAPSSLTRLRNMGIAPYNIVSSVSLISAQRLVRRLCVHCRQAVQVSQETQQEFELPMTPEPPVFYAAKGCAQCHKGYWGRVGIFQVMPLSQALQDLLLSDASQAQLSMQAQREGVLSLRQSGLQKALQGITSLEEVLAATSV
ncbi:MAG: Type 4 pili biogenesis protein pilB (nuleotide-binding protein) [Betaproteobacteria bacterium]|jgi:type IV pilus assembly protein PilB|nr:Type 4 pili biogenesis protein pilB (nuleotide-binding protein) [Betaproteobacteria bacterium]NBX90602.1 Type 4 pili biogenesis protein pilB (nuleotide-binding protein) [Betaproteobacteria bacterium]